MKIAVLGCGTVGGGVIEVLTRNAVEIAARAGDDLEIVQVCSRHKPPELDIGQADFSADLAVAIAREDVQVVVELIGGVDTARQVTRSALEAGKHVVTANKALIAEHGAELFELAKANGVVLAFEAAVAGGIPVIKALREGLVANRILNVAGIVNGTCNFILTEMRDHGRDFDTVLAEAQRLGYAESDPAFDIDGVDAAHKLCILASVAYGVPLEFNALHIEGIRGLSTADIAYAESLGYTIKHLAIARRSGAGIELRVHPTLISHQQLLSGVDGVMNAVMVQGDAVGDTLHYGQGAGAEATASAVIADLVDLARNTSAAIPALGYVRLDNAPPRVAMSEVTSAYYLRLQAMDHPGVLARVATILSAHEINIESVSQKESEQQDGLIPMVLLTHAVRESAMLAAIAELEALADLRGSVVMIRVELFQ